MFGVLSVVVLRWIAVCAALGALALPASAAAINDQVPLPPPEPGSFFTGFTYGHDGRMLAWDGFTVYIQQSKDSDVFQPIGSLPEEFRGATDPAFFVVSPNGRTILLGAGAGGSKFPDPDFNGNVWKMPITGGTAEFVGRFPFSILGTFYLHTNNKFLFSQADGPGASAGSIQLLDLRTNQARTIVADIPGVPDGVALDGLGNLYVGMGATDDGVRTGEIFRFDAADVEQAVNEGAVLDYDDDGTFVADVLNGGDLAFDTQNDLFVSGANFAENDLGYVAEVDPATGQVVDRFDPVDGDPNDGSFRFFAIEFTREDCTLGSLDLFSFFDSDPEIVYQRQVC
jgi:hypothetical protein